MIQKNPKKPQILYVNVETPINIVQDYIDIRVCVIIRKIKIN